MSGFEIAGIVLGALPFLIDALKKTNSGIQEWRYYQSTLDRLSRNLSTEQINIENICTRLLEKLVSPARIPLLIDNRPDMIAAWRDESLRQKIEYLLDSTFDLFKGTLEEIQKSADELKTKLGIRDGQILFIKTGEFINFEKAFVMMSFPESDSGSTGPASMDHGAALRCLGVVLIELEYEETIESLRRTHNTTPRSIYSAEIEGMLRLYGDATIDRLIRTRNWVGNYGRVVNLCMNGHHGTIDLNDKELRQEIYESIVQPLEVDWNLSTFRIPKLNS
ncbi:hypothetical protein CGCFRS4_v011477 [Colletotrichum fructicola]|nr:hypothetical protein CGCFRS4_v011477 [Colletotrichum fructicola]